MRLALTEGIPFTERLQLEGITQKSYKILVYHGILDTYIVHGSTRLEPLKMKTCWYGSCIVTSRYYYMSVRRSYYHSWGKKINTTASLLTMWWFLKILCKLALLKHWKVCVGTNKLRLLQTWPKIKAEMKSISISSVTHDSILMYRHHHAWVPATATDPHVITVAECPLSYCLLTCTTLLCAYPINICQETRRSGRLFSSKAKDWLANTSLCQDRLLFLELFVEEELKLLIPHTTFL